MRSGLFVTLNLFLTDFLLLRPPVSFQEAGGELCCEPGYLDSRCAERVRGEWFCQGAECFGAERCPEVYQAEEIHVEAIFSVSVAIDGLLVFAFFALC